MSVKNISRKKLDTNGNVVTEEMVMIQARVPRKVASVYRTLLSNKELTITKHIEHMIMNYIVEEKEKLKYGKEKEERGIL